MGSFCSSTSSVSSNVELCVAKEKAPSKSELKKDAEELKRLLLTCDGGAKIYAAAQVANGGKDPDIELGTPHSGFGGLYWPAEGKIVILKTQNKWKQMETLVFELANLSQKKEFDKITESAEDGNLSKDNYTRWMERTEVNSIKMTLKVLCGCKETWGCKEHKFDFEVNPDMTDFEKVYRELIPDEHKNHHRNFWVLNYKRAFETT